MHLRGNFALLAVTALTLLGAMSQARALSYVLSASGAEAQVFTTKNSFTSGFLNNYDQATGGLDSGFFNFNPETGESGTSSDYFSAIYSGNATTGYVVEITWGLNPKPILTGAFLKANQFNFATWDAADFADFNSNASYDKIILTQDLFANNRGRFHNVSHAGVFGQEGTTPPLSPVPDTGSTLFLFGAGAFAFLGLARFRPARA